MSIPVSKTLDEVRTDLYTRLSEVHATYAAKGWLPRALNLNKGVLRGLIELYAWGLYALYQFLFTIFEQAVPESATGAWLDLHCAQVGVTRRAATKAQGTVVFSRSGTSGNVKIAAGRIVKTLPDGIGAVYRYVTDADAVLPDGQTSVAVAVTAEVYGAAANVTVGSITEISTVIEGIETVNNAADWLTSEGADAEDDDSLRRRYTLAWKSQAGVTRASYEAAALSVPGVADVYVADQHPRGEGTVDVVVQGSAGLPTASLLDSVRDALESAIVINHDLQVKAPTAVNVEVRATLELVSGNAADVLATAEAWVRAMFASGDTDIPRFSIGKDVVRDRLASGLVSINGVKRIVWSSPAADVEIPSDGLAVLVALDLQTAWVDAA